MSEETTDKDQNFEALRKKSEAQEAQIAELTAYKVNEVVRSVNLDPNTGNGAALKELLGADVSEEKAQELVAKFGWQADEPSEGLTKDERAAQHFADQKADLQSVTVSDNPPNFNDQIAELNGLIAVAKAAGNHSEVRRLNTQLVSMNNRLLAQQMAAKARG